MEEKRSSACSWCDGVRKRSSLPISLFKCSRFRARGKTQERGNDRSERECCTLLLSPASPRSLALSARQSLPKKQRKLLQKRTVLVQRASQFALGGALTNAEFAASFELVCAVYRRVQAYLWDHRETVAHQSLTQDHPPALSLRIAATPRDSCQDPSWYTSAVFEQSLSTLDLNCFWSDKVEPCHCFTTSKRSRSTDKEDVEEGVPQEIQTGRRRDATNVCRYMFENSSTHTEVVVLLHHTQNSGQSDHEPDERLTLHREFFCGQTPESKPSDTDDATEQKAPIHPSCGCTPHAADNSSHTRRPWCRKMANAS